MTITDAMAALLGGARARRRGWLAGVRLRLAGDRVALDGGLGRYTASAADERANDWEISH